MITSISRMEQPEVCKRTMAEIKFFTIAREKKMFDYELLNTLMNTKGIHWIHIRIRIKKHLFDVFSNFIEELGLFLLFILTIKLQPHLTQRDIGLNKNMIIFFYNDVFTSPFCLLNFSLSWLQVLPLWGRRSFNTLALIF